MSLCDLCTACLGCIAGDGGRCQFLCPIIGGVVQASCQTAGLVCRVCGGDLGLAGCLCGLDRHKLSASPCNRRMLDDAGRGGGERAVVERPRSGWLPGPRIS